MDPTQETPLPASNQSPKKQSILQWLVGLKDRRKELFWAWIIYQAVKGLITTSLIWIPLIMWWTRGGS